MKNAQQQLTWVREHVRDLNTSVFEERCSVALRSAWKTKENAPSSHSHTIAKKPLSLARAFGFATAGLLVVVLAAVATLKVGDTQKITEVSKPKYVGCPPELGCYPQLVEPVSPDKELGLYYGEAIGLGTSSLQQRIPWPLRPLATSFIEGAFTDERHYTYGDGQQLFDESVGYDMKVKDDSELTANSIRGQAHNLGGAVISIKRGYGLPETVVRLEIPSTTITVFEAYLKSLALEDSFQRVAYSAENVSEKVVVIDEEIARTEEQLKYYEKQLSVTRSTTIRRRIEKNIAAAERALKNGQEKRANVIQKYDMVKVSVRITEWKSFFSGAYWQYDRDTPGGNIMYQLSRGLYVFTNSLGFILWLLVYAFIAALGWKLLRKLFGRRRYDDL